MWHVRFASIVVHTPDSARAVLTYRHLSTRRIQEPARRRHNDATPPFVSSVIIAVVTARGSIASSLHQR